MKKLRDRSELTAYIVYPCLDLGTGEAYPFGGRLPDGVIGIDKEPKVPNTVKHDLLNGIPFKDKSFETVTAFEIFEHIPPDKREFLVEEIKRVCRKRVIISVPDKSDRRSFPLDNPSHEHNLHPDWLFDLREAIELAEKFSKNYEIFEIENEFHYGYGLVIYLEEKS